jgi:hypothetical protein
MQTIPFLFTKQTDGVPVSEPYSFLPRHVHERQNAVRCLSVPRYWQTSAVNVCGIST